MKQNFILTILFAFLTVPSKAGTCYSIANGNWNSSSTWLFGNIPGSGDDAVIANSNTITVTANTSCKSITIGNGLLSAATAVTINAGVTLTVSGNITLVAPLLGTTDNALNVNAGTVSCTSISTSNSLQDNKRCVVNISTGTLTCSGSFIMANNTTRNKLTFSGAGLLQIGGNSSTLLDAQFTASTGTVEYTSASSQNILVVTYNTLKCSGTGTKSLTSNLQSKNLIVSSGTTLNIAVGNTLSVSDAFTNNHIITGAGTVQLNGTAAQTIDGTGTMTNLRLNNSNGATILNNTGNMVNITSKYTPTAGVLTTNNKMTLKSDASGSAVIAAGSSSGNYISGKVTVERYVPSRRAWRLVAFPITSTGSPTINEALQEGAGGTSSNPNPGYGTHITGGSVANGFDQNSVNNPSFKELVSGNWQGVVTTNQAITNQSMYLMFVRGSRANNLSQLTAAVADNTTLRITGNVKQGNQSVSVSGTGWQPIPNPFASVVSLNSIATANNSLMNNNFTFWDPKMGGTNNVGAFVTASYNGSSYDVVPTPTSSLSEYAQPFSVFFIDAISTGSLSIPESAKCNCGNDNVFRPSASSQAKLSINLLSVNPDGSTPVVDGVLAAYSAQFSNDIDGFDPEKNISVLGENLFIKRGDKKLAIERRASLINDETIELGFTNMRLRSYQFEIIPKNIDWDSMTVFLEDNFKAERIQIKADSTFSYHFSFTSNPESYSSNRFRIIVKKLEPQVLPVTISSIRAASLKNSGIQIRWKTENEVAIEKYEIMHSIDGINFLAIGEIQYNNQNNLSEYDFIHKKPFKGTNYYRVKAIEKSGKSQFSTIVKTSIAETVTGISLFTNPVSNNSIRLQLSGIAGKYLFSIFTSGNKKIFSTHFLHNGIDKLETISLKHPLQPGIYTGIIESPENERIILKILAE